MGETQQASPMTLPEVARKRAWQTAAQGLAIDVAVAVAVLVLSSLDSITNKSAVIAFGVTLAKTVVSTVCAWVIRRYQDRSGFDGEPEPEALPAGEPDDPVQPERALPDDEQGEPHGH